MKTHPMHLRLTDAQLRKLDALAAIEQKQTTATVTRATVLRALIDAARAPKGKAR